MSEIVIKKYYLTRLQHLAIKIFSYDDDENSKGSSSCWRWVEYWLNKITDDEHKKWEIYGVVDDYKFDMNWDRTYAELKEKGYELED